MAVLGYHASHEQFAPEDLAALVRRAQEAGFDAAMCSDHFHPWSEEQGHSGYAWSWLGAAMATTALPFGVVTSPVGRYHPAIIAQASATLARMFPGRFWLAVGSGEALNESITGDVWPEKQQRNARLLEAVMVMRALWAGEEVSHRGSFQVQCARLFSRPAQPPALLAAALTEKTARWAGAWADGLITVSVPAARLRAIVDAFREGGGAGKPLYLQVKLSYAKTEEEALAGAHAQWRTNVLPPAVSEVLNSPRHYQALAGLVRPEDMHGAVRISSDLQRHAAWLRQDMELGFEHLYLHNVNCDQARFIDDFASVIADARQPAHTG
jgi:coenzyme F420-dependent glucose-6-phosphate dehydrogenase